MYNNVNIECCTFKLMSLLSCALCIVQYILSWIVFLLVGTACFKGGAFLWNESG